MAAHDGLVPRPPQQLRAAHLGALLIGRVVIGDIGAAVADLAVRRLAELAEADGQWLVKPAASAARLESLPGFERTLLRGLAAVSPSGGPGAAPVAISAQTPGIAELLASTRSEITADAVSRGWLRRLQHGRRTGEGDKLAERTRAFQRSLRGFAAYQPGPLPDALLPFALRFGLLSNADLPLARFARHWTASLSPLPGWHQPPPPKREVPIRAHDYDSWMGQTAGW